MARAISAGSSPCPAASPQPLALRYHGHQFRMYNPDIGDGRGFLFAQLRDDRGRLMDLGTKGSGQTPWSRFGDGRLTLKGGVREILATEMLEALGVETSRSFSLIETGEALERGDEPSPTRSAVLVRLEPRPYPHRHVPAARLRTDAERMARLVDYVLVHLHGEQPGPIRGAAARATSSPAPRGSRRSYMAAGFVHGVLNTDNINVTGESFDYGPWRFAPTWDPAFTAAYFDHQGLYAFGRQPEAIHWDVGAARGRAARAVAGRAADRGARDLRRPLPGRQSPTASCGGSASCRAATGEDRASIQAVERGAARDRHRPRPLLLRRVRRPRPRRASSGTSSAPPSPPYAPRKRRDHAYWSGAPCAMLIDEVEALWAAIDRTRRLGTLPRQGRRDPRDGRSARLAFAQNLRQ